MYHPSPYALALRVSSAFNGIWSCIISIAFAYVPPLSSIALMRLPIFEAAGFSKTNSTHFDSCNLLAAGMRLSGVYRPVNYALALV